MPEVDIQRRDRAGIPWWLWLIGALVLALIIWAVVAATNDERVGVVPPENEQVAVVPPVEQTDEERVAGERLEERGAFGEPLPLADLRANPAGFEGNTLAGTATVSEMVSDRAFWVEQNGQRLFVTAERPVTGVNVGDQVFIEGTAETLDAGETPRIEGLGSDVMQTLGQEPAFIRAANVRPANQAGVTTEAPNATPEPGTTAAPGTTEMTEPGATETREPATTR